jgi:hypothetical protein
MYPLLINEGQLIEFGYYSGIVSAVDDMRELYPVLFDKYDQCTVPHSEYSNREKFMAFECKVRAGMEPRKTATQLRKESNGLYRLRSRLNERKNNTKYRPLTEKEIIHIIELLEGTPAHEFAQKLQVKS